jgi:hypothetical protein
MKFIDLRNGKAVAVWELPGEMTPLFLDKGWVAKSVQVSGEFFGGRVDLCGTNFIDGEEYVLLNDPNGNSLDFSVPRIEQILEDCVKIVPRYVGSPNMNIKVSVLLFQVR